MYILIVSKLYPRHFRRWAGLSAHKRKKTVLKGKIDNYLQNSLKVCNLAVKGCLPKNFSMPLDTQKYLHNLPNMFLLGKYWLWSIWYHFHGFLFIFFNAFGVLKTNFSQSFILTLKYWVVVSLNSYCSFGYNISISP